MGKVKVKYPSLIMPVCLVGANVGGKPNFAAIAWFTFLESQPIVVGFASDKGHYTNRGICENKAFSLNIPSVSMAMVTDFCGLYSGSEVDKSGVFDVFYGELEKAPMIRECCVNMECKHVKTVEFMRNEFVVGEVVGVYANDECLSDGKVDLAKANPLLYEGGAVPYYWRLGQRVGRAFEIGKNYKPKLRQK